MYSVEFNKKVHIINEGRIVHEISPPLKSRRKPRCKTETNLGFENAFVLISYLPKQSQIRNGELKGLPEKIKSPATSVINTQPYE